MKVPRRISVSVLMVLFLTTGLSYGQSAAKQHLTKGVDYAAQGKFREAKEELEKALEVDPFLESAKESLQVIEDVNDKKIESKAAIHLFKGAAHVIKSQLGEAITQYDQAISDFTKAIEINPKYAEAYSSRGLAHEEGKGQYDQAISDYTKAIEISPRYVDAYNNRGFIYMVRLEDKKKACADWKRACELGSCRNYEIARRSGDCE